MSPATISHASATRQTRPSSRDTLRIWRSRYGQRGDLQRRQTFLPQLSLFHPPPKRASGLPPVRTPSPPISLLGKPPPATIPIVSFLARDRSYKRPSHNIATAAQFSLLLSIMAAPRVDRTLYLIWHDISPTMDTATAISDEVRGALQCSYPDSQQQMVLERLLTVSTEWTRQSILILANGDYSTLCELIELAKLDWRAIPLRMDPRSFDGLAADELVRRRTRMGLSLPHTHAEINAERLRQDVIGFIAERMIVPIDQLSDSTELQSDLRLAGTDGDRFVRAFAGQFDVDLKGYDFRSHFAPQPGENLWADINALVFGRKQPTTIPITVRDLLVAAETHRWMPGPENAR